MKKEREAEVDMRYATKRDVLKAEVKVKEMLIEHITLNGAQFQQLNEENTSLSQRVAALESQVYVLENQVKKLFAQKYYPRTTEFLKHQAMKECIHSIGEAIKKYNGR